VEHARIQNSRMAVTMTRKTTIEIIPRIASEARTSIDSGIVAVYFQTLGVHVLYIQPTPNHSAVPFCQLPTTFQAVLEEQIRSRSSESLVSRL
jgi:hypothetical protein